MENITEISNSSRYKAIGNGWTVDVIAHILKGVADAMYMYHQSAVGHACGQEVKTDISWHGERAAHFICNSMSQGACIIDQDGVVKTNKETKGK